MKHVGRFTVIIQEECDNLLFLFIMMFMTRCYKFLISYYLLQNDLSYQAYRCRSRLTEKEATLCRRSSSCKEHEGRGGESKEMG